MSNEAEKGRELIKNVLISGLGLLSLGRPFCEAGYNSVWRITPCMLIPWPFQPVPTYATHVPVARKEPQPERYQRAEAHMGTFQQWLPGFEEGIWAEPRPCLPPSLVTRLLAHSLACLSLYRSEMASSDRCTEVKDMIRASLPAPMGMSLMSATRMNLPPTSPRLACHQVP